MSARAELDFAHILGEYLRESREERPRRIGVYNASEIGGECLRQLYLRYDAPRPFDQFTLGVFKIGNILHDWAGVLFREYFERGGRRVEVEKSVPPYHYGDWEIHGRADLVLDDLVVDFKTVSPNMLRKKLPLESHRVQLNYYLGQLGVGRGIVLYIDKYALRLVSRWIEYDPRLFDETMRRVAILHSSLLDGAMPPRCSGYPTEYPCTWCDYRREECAR